MDQITTGRILKVSYVILISLFVFGIYKYNINFYNKSADKLVKHFHQRDSIINSEISSLPDSIVQLTKLKSQYKIIQEIKEPYLSISQTFGSNGYAFTMVFALISILTGVFAFLIVKKGWDNTTNFYLKSGFLILFFFSTLSGVIQAVSDTKQNAQKNIERYYFYNGLQMDIYDYAKDNQGFLRKKEYAKIDTFLHNQNKFIKNNPDIYFNIDIDKVPKSFKPPIE